VINQYELIQPFPRQLAATSTIPTGGAIDSLFIVNSLLSAVIKDCLPAPDETSVAISKLRQEIIILLEEDNVSYSYFAYVDTQFYLMLSMLKGYHRLAMLILSEKRHIDMAIGDAIKTQENYKAIFRCYANILDGIRSNNYHETSMALGELSKTLRTLMLKI
jgi:hypothetical protein